MSSKQKINLGIKQLVKHFETSPPLAQRCHYSLNDLLVMQAGRPLMMEASWQSMPAVGQEVAF